MILEVLREQPEMRYPMQDIDLLADEFKTSEPKVRTIICNYGLFDVDQQEMFYSPKLFEYMEPYFKMKEQRRLAGEKSAQARQKKITGSTDAQRPFNDRSTTEQQSKVKESKVNKSKVFIPPTLNEFIKYFTENDFTPEYAKHVFKYYNDADWVDSKGNPVKNWKQKVRGVWFKDENKHDPRKQPKEHIPQYEDLSKKFPNPFDKINIPVKTL